MVIKPTFNHVQTFFEERLDREIMIIIVLISFQLLTGLMLMMINGLTYDYHGVDYFNHTYQNASIPTILYLAAVIYFKDHLSQRIRLILMTFGLYFLALDAGLLLAQGIQITPFPTIDYALLAFDRWLGVDQVSWLSAVHQIPWLRSLFVWGYNSLVPELMVLPMLVAILGHERRIVIFLIAMLLSYLIGTLIFYFFPTTAPASILDSPYFTFEQHDTYIKFYEMHHHLRLTTTNGGLIAFPSFHVIWGILMIYLARARWWLFIPALIWNIILISSTVFLGWHYVADVFGGFAVAAVTILVGQWVWRHSLRIKQTRWGSLENQLDPNKQ